MVEEPDREEPEDEWSGTIPEPEVLMKKIQSEDTSDEEAGSHEACAVHRDRQLPETLRREPIAYRNWEVRMKICPSETAGELSV